MNLTKIWPALAVMMLGLCLAAAHAAELPAAGADAGPYALRLQLVWACAAVAAVVYAAMVYGLMASKRPKQPAGARRAGGSRRAELMWALIPAVILIGLALPAVDTLAGLAAESEQGPAVTLAVPGAK